jgi:hypothetical protein
MNEPVSPLAGAPAGPSSALLLEDEAGALLRLAPSTSPDGLLASVRARLQEDPSARALRGLSLRVDFGDQLPEPLTLRRLLVMLRGEFAVGISGLRCTPEALQRYAERTLQVPIRLSGGNLLPEMFEGPPPGLDALDQWLGLLPGADLRCAPAAPAIEETPQLAEVPEDGLEAGEGEASTEGPAEGLSLGSADFPASIVSRVSYRASESGDAHSDEGPQPSEPSPAVIPQLGSNPDALASTNVGELASPSTISLRDELGLPELVAAPGSKPALDEATSSPAMAADPAEDDLDLPTGDSEPSVFATSSESPAVSAPAAVLENANSSEGSVGAAVSSSAEGATTFSNGNAANHPDEGPSPISPVPVVSPLDVPGELFRQERPGDDQPWWVREGDRRVLAISRTLRSGASVRFPGDVVVYGDVNAGAEIEAGGNIVVLGSLRGLAHAGAQGESEAIVLAFDLRPAQLRISDQIYFPANASKAPGLLSLLGRERTKPAGFQPMLAMIRSGVIHLEDWRGKLPF